MQSVYSTSPADWSNFRVKDLTRERERGVTGKTLTESCTMEEICDPKPALFENEVSFTSGKVTKTLKSWCNGEVSWWTPRTICCAHTSILEPLRNMVIRTSCVLHIVGSKLGQCQRKDQICSVT